MVINSKKVQYFVSLSNVFLAVVSILSGSSNNGNMKDHKPELKVINITDVLRPKKLRQIAKTGTVDKKGRKGQNLRRKKLFVQNASLSILLSAFTCDCRY